MIVVKTRLKQKPKTCKTCTFAWPDPYTGEKSCVVKGNRLCPLDVSENGRICYCMPEWCPLTEVNA